MLLSFKVKNYRSFKEEINLDMEAVKLKQYNECILKAGKSEYLPVIAIYGKNGGGKSNLIRAFWLAVEFIKNAQRTQHEKANVPVQAFELDDYSKKDPTFFEFNYIYDDIKYIYGFSATKSEITEEYLYYSPNGKKALIFSRVYQNFNFPEDAEKKKKEMISEAVASNQLFFAISCTMNYKPCIKAMKWFREAVVFSRDYTDIRYQLGEYGEDISMLNSIISIAKIADLGIKNMKFDINNIDITNLKDIPENFSEDEKETILKALKELQDALESGPNVSEGKLKISEIKATSYHAGIDNNGNQSEYQINISEESDGTKRLMALAPAIEKSINNGGIFIIDEIERELNPLLVEYIINKFQKNINNHGKAQLIFTTHSTEIMGRELLRRDQIYFVDKNSKSGVSELYSLSDFSPRKDENIYKSYMLGKYGAIPFIEEV